MPYQIERNGQMYGPYTLEDLQRYVVSGHVLPSDLAKDETMASWVPVSQLLASMGAAAPTPAAGYPVPPTPYTQAAAVSPYPDPPNLHWALVLLLDIVTCSLFQAVWNIVLAAWFRRLYPPSKALAFYIASAVLLLTQGIMGQALGFMTGHHAGNYYNNPFSNHPGGYGIYGLVATICWVTRLVARFTFRGELERHYNTVEPIGLQINPVLTFFFGGLYLQSVMNRINDIKHGLRYR